MSDTRFGNRDDRRTPNVKRRITPHDRTSGFGPASIREAAEVTGNPFEVRCSAFAFELPPD
jgi:hypothetical protein